MAAARGATKSAQFDSDSRRHVGPENGVKGQHLQKPESGRAAEVSGGDLILLESLVHQVRIKRAEFLKISSTSLRNWSFSGSKAMP